MLTRATAFFEEGMMLAMYAVAAGTAPQSIERRSTCDMSLAGPCQPSDEIVGGSYWSGQHRVELIRRSSEFQCLAGSLVQLQGNRIQLLLRVGGQVNAFGKVLPQQSVGVL